MVLAGEVARESGRDWAQTAAGRWMGGGDYQAKSIDAHGEARGLIAALE
jgi:hypothetical protein